MKKTYILNPNMTLPTLKTNPATHKPKTPVAQTSGEVIVAAPTSPYAHAVVVPPARALPRPHIDPNKPMLKLGLDVHLEFIMAVGQHHHASPHAPRKFTRAQLVEYVRQHVAKGFQVFCVQESCGFGFVLHRELVAAGAQSFLITPVALSGKRKTDKLDARALCQRLTRFLDGNHEELATIRIPSETEQRRRETTRRRRFLKEEIRRLANRGHALVAEYRHEVLASGWWGPRKWKKLTSALDALDAWLLGVLENLRELILAVDRQLKEIEQELLQRVKGQPRPKGLGELTLVTLDAEICDWGRFNNRKQTGSYTGCCPGEHSSGRQRRVGAIDRMGNSCVRALLVEAVWRFLKWQPNWKAAQPMKVKLADGPSLRKKTVVALARQLAVDLWRWRTGRCTLQDLGLIEA